MLIPFGKNPEVKLAVGLDVMLNTKYTNKRDLLERAKMFSLEHAGKALCDVVSGFRKESLGERD